METAITKKLTGQRNQCPTCGLYFNSNAAFTKHRVGDYYPPSRHCLTPDEMLVKGMVLGGDGFWRGSAMSEDVLARRIGDAGESD